MECGKRQMKRTGIVLCGAAGPTPGRPKSQSLLPLAEAGALSKQRVDAPRLVCGGRWGRWSGEQ